MIQYARAGFALASDGQIGVDRIELQLIGDLSEKLAFEITELGLDRPHELDRIGDEGLERLESVAQFRPSVRRIEQRLETRLRPRGKDHANGGVAAGIRKGVERDIDAVAAVTLDLGNRVVDGPPRAPADENKMRDLRRHAGPPRYGRNLAPGRA